MAVSMRNKIKNLWKKFKHWLIRKLGGYVAPTQKLEIKHTDYPTVKYQTRATWPTYGREIPIEIIKQDLAEDLAKAILSEMNLQTFEHQELEIMTYVAEIEIVKRS